MGVSTTITGARCLFKVNGVVQGMFTDVNFGQDYSAEDLYVIGRLPAADIVYTAANTITVSATGYRSFNNGAFVVAAMPTINQMRSFSDISLEIEDVNNKKGIFNVFHVKPLGYGSRASARGVMEMTINFRGLLAGDESQPNGNDDSGAPGLLQS